ncbi:hypothetical protein MKX03_001505, partial [Papaver bracteatum]
MARQAPIIALLMISGLWIVCSAGDFGDKYTDLHHGDLFYTCVYFKHLEYDRVETQKNLCEIVYEIKFNTSNDEKIQTEKPDSFDGPNLVDTFNSDKLMDWCFFNRPDDKLGKQTQSDACEKLIEIVKPYKEEDVKEDYNYTILESLAVEGEEIKEENLYDTLESLAVEGEDITEEANEYFVSIQKELQESKANLATKMRGLNQ